jgi:elongation factor Ts
MADISASLVKSLREKTGAGMMDCKRALAENGADMEAAVDWLRKKGLSAAAKKSGRVASEGLIGLATGGHSAALVEVNSETDFVARNEHFQAFVRAVAALALKAGGDLAALQAMAYPGSGETVQGQLTNLIATIGENMNLRRTAYLAVDEGFVATYLHNVQAEGLGRIGVLVALQSAAPRGVLEALGKKLAMHVAAANPAAVSRDQVDQSQLDRERNILSEQARASGKPEAIIAKMVEGRLSKFYEDICLLEQTFVIDGESKVGAVIEAAAKEAGQPINVLGFVRLSLGEGVEKPAAETAAA